MGEKNKNRKIGRIKKSSQNLRYRNENRHEKSHVRRIAKHLKRFPDDKVATRELQRYKIAARIVSASP